jgi:hypothetical protein
MSLDLEPALASAPKRKTPHFHIHYSPRDAAGERTRGDGVRSEDLINAYAEALEAAWTDLQMLPKEVSHPSIAAPGVIQCVVTDVPEPVCSVVIRDEAIKPILALPCCYPELADWPAVLDMARCSARHEPAHAWACRVWSELWLGLDVLNSHRGIRQLLAEPAHWLSEGHAVALEAGNSPTGYWLQHASSWCDRPEISLFEEPYAAGFFARYLDRRLGLKPGEVFSRAISTITAPPQGPDRTVHNAQRLVWQALNRVLQPSLTAEEAWLESCRAGAFIGGSSLPADEEMAVFQRYGRRAVADSFDLRINNPTISRPYLGSSLSCRYFSLTLPTSAKTIGLEAILAKATVSPRLRVGLWSETNAAVGAWLPSGQTDWLLPVKSTEHSEHTRWTVVCALVPDDSGGESDSTWPISWTLRLEAR